MQPNSVEQSESQLAPVDILKIGSLVHGSIKDYGRNSESEGNNEDKLALIVSTSPVQREASLSPVPTSLNQEETSLSPVANTNEGYVRPINQVESSLPTATPLRVIEVQK